MKNALVLIVTFWGLHAYADTAQTILCAQGNWNLYMQMAGEQILSAQLESGGYTGSVDPNDISYSGSEAYIRTDVEYNATGSFTNCHTL